MHFLVSPLYRSRHPLVRLASVLLGLALLGLLLFFGLLAAGVLLVGGSVLLLWRYWTRARRATFAKATNRAAKPPVLEGEFVVLRNERPTAR